jgi:hypothetical protein
MAAETDRATGADARRPGTCAEKSDATLTPIRTRTNRLSPLIPIRQLLKALPEALPASPRATDDLQKLWSSCALGWTRAGFQSADPIRHGPGPEPHTRHVPDNQLSAPVATDQRADMCGTTSTPAFNEHALLLFCPTAPAEIADEAAWRLARSAVSDAASISACGSSCNWDTRCSVPCAKSTVKPGCCWACNHRTSPLRNCCNTFSSSSMAFRC